MFIVTDFYRHNFNIMSGIPKKKKKSGFEFKKEREAFQRNEAAGSCSKITNFLVPKSQNNIRNENVPVLEGEDTLSASASTSNTINVGLFTPKSKNNAQTENFPVVAREDTLPASTSDTSNIDFNHSDNDSNFILNKDDNHLVQLEKVYDEDAQSFFKKPLFNNINAFFSFHPHQPPVDLEAPLPFDIGIFKRNSNENFKRNWLSYNRKDQKLYCSVCLAFTDNDSVFCKGFDRYRHLTQTVGEHEKSKAHLEAVKCYVAHSQNKTLDHLLFEKQLNKRKQEVAERRKVVHGVIDVVKLIGKQGLALRGKRHEAGYSLGDNAVNHGNFLEIFLLLSNYDHTLEKHVKTVITTSTNALEKSKKKKRGRGSQISFLSKTTIMKIVGIIKEIILDELVCDIKKAVKFSILMDTTIDISGYDQCAIVVRYVDGKEVKERLLGLKTVQSSTAQGLLQDLLTELEKHELKVGNCVADAFDGASNMSGEYNGVSAKLKELVPNHTHTWCYAHVLNLVMTNTAQCLPQTISFFGLLQEAQVFIKESCKRLNVWMDKNPKIRLTAIGATRWRSRSDATTKIFGFASFWFDNIETENVELRKSVYPDLVISLNIISNSMEFNSKSRSDANALLSKFLSFETILVAMIFLNIFRFTTVLSDYLQTKNLDFAQAWAFVEKAQKSLGKVRDDYEAITKASKKFVRVMTSLIAQKIENDSSIDVDGLQIEMELPQKRARAVKRIHGQTTEYQDAFKNSSVEEKFRIKVFNVIMDTITSTIQTRFADQKTLYLDLACFDPRQFSELKKNGLPQNALNKICTLVQDIDKSKLYEELQSLFDVWPTLHCSIQDKFSKADIACCSSQSEESEDEELKTCTETTKCTQCPKCVFSVIYDYNMYTVSYTELYKAYKFILTIPLTQVSCERTFSTLKFLKTRLRSTINQDHLEALLIMEIERQKVSDIDNDLVISKMCEKSEEMRSLLVF